jgi:RNA polymerase primary sigma factor
LDGSSYIVPGPGYGGVFPLWDVTQIGWSSLLGFIGKTGLGKNQRDRDKGRGLKGRVFKRSYRPEQRNDALIIADALDLDGVSDIPGLRVENENALVRGEGEVVEYKLEPFGKAADPGRIYLKEMGSFPLLTREGEVEIARRIESGQREVLSLVLNCPIAVREVLNLGNAFKTGKIEIKALTHEIDEETSVAAEEIQKRKILNLIHKMQKGEDRIQLLQKKLKHRKKGFTQKKVQEEISKKRAEIFEALRRINLRESEINKIVKKLKQWDIRMEKAARGSKKDQLGTMELECGLSSSQLKEVLRAIKKGEAKVLEAKSELVKANLS